MKAPAHVRRLRASLTRLRRAAIEYVSYSHECWGAGQSRNMHYALIYGRAADRRHRRVCYNLKRLCFLSARDSTLAAVVQKLSAAVQTLLTDTRFYRDYECPADIHLGKVLGRIADARAALREKLS